MSFVLWTIPVSFNRYARGFAGAGRGRVCA